MAFIDTAFFSNAQAKMINSENRGRYATEYAQRVGSPVHYQVTGITSVPLHGLLPKKITAGDGNNNGNNYNGTRHPVIILGEIPWNVALYDITLMPVNIGRKTKPDPLVGLDDNGAMVNLNFFVIPNKDAIHNEIVLKDENAVQSAIPLVRATDIIAEDEYPNNISCTNGLGIPMTVNAPSFCAAVKDLNLTDEAGGKNSIMKNTIHIGLQHTHEAFSRSLLATMYRTKPDTTCEIIPSFKDDKVLKNDIQTNLGLLCMQIEKQQDDVDYYDAAILAQYALGYRYTYSNLNINETLW